MIGDAIAWACRTPRRLALVAAGMLVALVAAAAAATGGGAAGGSGRATTAATPSPTAAARVPDSAPFVSAAVRFAGEWGHISPGETQDRWLARVSPLVTGDLAAALTDTDPAALPGARPAGEPVVRYLSGTSALVAVPLDDGTRVLVTVVAEGPAWLVGDVQPEVGDHGDTRGSGA